MDRRVESQEVKPELRGASFDLVAESARASHAPGPGAVGASSAPSNALDVGLPARGLREIAAAAPIWLWLTVLVGVSAFYQYGFARGIRAPFIFADELIYSELAKGLSETLTPSVREVATQSYGLLYSALLAPSYALFESVTHAYEVMKATNAVVMSLAAIPTYLLARRVLSPGSSFLAAVLALLVPSMAFTGTIMTENAFYPLFLCCALAIVRALERPSAGRQLTVLGLIGLAFLTRAQAVVLLPAFVTAIAGVALLDAQAASGRISVLAVVRGFRPFRPTGLALGGGLLLVLAYELFRGLSPLEILGAYRPAIERFSPTALPRWLLYHLGELDLYLGVVPFAAFLVMVAIAARRSESSRPLRLLVATSASLVFWLALSVASFATLPEIARIHERNLFYVAPLFLVFFLVWLERGLPRPRRVTIPIALAAIVSPALLPFGYLRYLAGVDAFALVPWVGSGLSDGSLPFAVLIATALAGLCFLFVPARLSLVAVMLVFANFLVIGTIARAQFEQGSKDAQAAGIGVPGRDWIDRAVGPDANVSVVWSQLVPRSELWEPRFAARRRAIWESEFFNRSLRRVYTLGLGMPYNLPSTELTLGLGGSLLDRRTCSVVSAQYVLAHESLGLEGRVVATDPRTRMALFAVSGPVRLTAPPTHRGTAVRCAPVRGGSG